MRATFSRASARTFFGLLALAGLLAIAACSEKGSVPICENCDKWHQLTLGLARYPSPHPTNAAVFAFSTIEKTPGAPDANREADEDIWLSWVVSDSNPSANRVWQITGDGMGTIGDNFAPRWAPGGDQIAFVHSTGAGVFEIWRVPVTLPATANDAPVVGTPERITTGRDVAWASETRLVFTRDNKLYQVDVPPPTTPLQLSFNPPTYASGDEFVDRTPDFSVDGAGVFNSIARENVADLYLRAFEIDRSIAPPETLATDAFVYFQPPGGIGAFPIFEGSDTLRTPVLLRSLPVGPGGDFLVGVSLENRLLSDHTRESYCDTTIKKVASLQPGDADTLNYYFDIARGTLKVQSNAANTNVSWTRADGLASGSATILSSGQTKVWNCLLSYTVTGGVPSPPNLETYVIVGQHAGSPDTTLTVLIAPGDTTSVVLYPSGGAADKYPVASLGPEISGRSRLDVPGGLSLSSILRASAATSSGSLWRLVLSNGAAQFFEILSTDDLIQSPAISDEVSGVRYLAYVANPSEQWALYVQRIVVDHSGPSDVWHTDGAPVRVEPPGTAQNLACTRNVFYPRFLGTSAPGNLHVLVAMSNCPDNGFGSLGFDEDPWAIGELRVWEVDLNLQ